MLTRVFFRSLILEKPILMLESTASLTGCHVAGTLSSVLESGFSPMDQTFQHRIVLQCFTETEEMMEVSD